MWYVAFTLGLFGSLHCIGMCGPLAIAFTSNSSSSKTAHFFSGLAYNLGRTVTYSILGLIFGVFGTLFMLTNLQQSLSIILGLLLIISFVFSIDIEHKLNSSNFLSKYYTKVRNFISSLMQKAIRFNPFILGLANGLLPCGLVYLAIAGSLSTGSLIGGMLFMMYFGLGTIPALFSLILGSQFFPLSWRNHLRKTLPYISLIFGIFLIIRGIKVDVPQSLDFWTMMKNPLMCH